MITKTDFPLLYPHIEKSFIEDWKKKYNEIIDNNLRENIFWKHTLEKNIHQKAIIITGSAHTSSIKNNIIPLTPYKNHNIDVILLHSDKHIESTNKDKFKIIKIDDVKEYVRNFVYAANK
jgi:hypothetical protein